ncbi:MAG: hypothetical protein COB69_05645 [Phycisphaera sp.]|nr:MAG: hypothetical protein COB69_05645 [Phycisphaera sp.]
MLTIFLATSMLLAQPEEFFADYGLVPDTRYEITVHQYRESGGIVSRDAHGRVVLKLHEPQEGPSVLFATIELDEHQITPEQLDAIGMTPEDLQSTAEFVLDEQYNIVGVRNWEELRDKANTVASNLMDAMVEQGLSDPETAQKAKTAMSKLTNTEAGVHSIYSKRISTYLFGYGWELTESEPLVQEVSLSNPFGGEPLPAITTTKLDDDPETPNLIEYTYEQALESEPAVALIRDALLLMGIPDNKDLIENLRGLQITDLMEWSYDKSQRLIIHAQVERTMKLPGQPLSIERWTWELVDIKEDGQ